MVKNYYQILGVYPGCSEGDIKQAYRKLALKFHPDKNPDDQYFEEMFKEINKAYELLSNKDKRKKYDEYLYQVANPYKPSTATNQPANKRPIKKPFWQNPRLILFSCYIAVIGIIALVKTPSENEPLGGGEPSKNVVYDKLPPSKFKGNQLVTGASPYEDYFGSSVYSKDSKNSLEVKNGQDLDAIVCLTEVNSPHRTIRNEYIRAGDTFVMTGIPNGVYSLKTFYGKYWNPDASLFNGELLGQFDTLSAFSVSENSDDLLKMYQSKREYSVYSVTLYPVTNGNMESKSVTLNDFFKK